MLKDRYLLNKEKLLKDSKINPKNRELMERFLEFEEYKLKRKEGLIEFDEHSAKTLKGYVGRLKRLNLWFHNKPWEELTYDDIKKFIDDFEDGNLKTSKGARFKDRSGYYQMMQGKLFALAKRSHIAREIFEEFSIVGRDFNTIVRFIEEESFRKIVDCAINLDQRALLWLSFDIGENIGSLIELEKEDFKRQINPDTNEPEYLVILSKEKLKRSRTPRSEITNYKETVKYLDLVLDNLKPATKETSNKIMKPTKLRDIHGDNKLFKFGITAADKFLRRAVEKSGVRCLPGGEKVTWKDLRSSMACDLLKKGWSRDEVNARLGHKPSSRIIDRYINYLALDRGKPKKKIYEGNLKKMEIELEKQKEINKLQLLRYETLKKDQEEMKETFKLLMNKSKNELMEALKELNSVEEKEMAVKN
jgi:site-specific recombinase XerD